MPFDKKVLPPIKKSLFGLAVVKTFSNPTSICGSGLAIGGSIFNGFDLFLVITTKIFSQQKFSYFFAILGLSFGVPGFQHMLQIVDIKTHNIKGDSPYSK